MTLLEFFRLIHRYWKILLIFPLTTAIAVFFLTKNSKKEYSSSCEVYTGIASGYGITSGENDRIDYFAVNNAFDNLMATIKSRETIEEVGMRLLAKHLLIDKPSYAILSKENYDHLKEIIPDDLRKKLISKKSEELTYFRIESYKRASTKNEIIELLKSNKEIYSFDYISSNMSAVRKQSSDMIDISYKCGDPAACQQTLQLIVDVVMVRYKGIKGSETNNVVKYFEDQLRLAANQLRKSEDHLRDFRSENKIIFYDEQAKFTAESKENVLNDQERAKMDLDASKAALAKVEHKMNLKKGVLDVNENILKLKGQLADINYKIANAELYNEDQESISSLKEDAEKLKRQIKLDVESQYKFNNTTEGLPRLNLLQEWLSNYLAIDENQSKLDVVEKRLDGFDAIYTELAPIGSNLKRIEREVDVNEKEYLSVLHGLNMAKLRQQSLAMSNNLTIIDTPFLPLEPSPSKRGMLIIVSFVAIFIVTLASIVAKSLLGKTVQTPARVEKFTGLQFIGAVPDYTKLNKHISIDTLDNTIYSLLTSSIRVQLKNVEKKENSPYILLVASSQPGYGKSVIFDKISNAFSNNLEKTIWITNGSNELTKVESNKNLKRVEFNSLNEQRPTTDILTWLGKEKIDYKDCKYIIIELESLNKYNVPEAFINAANLNVIILEATQVWSEADARSLSNFTKLSQCKSFVILNNIEIERLESLIGEIPKKRSFLRKLLKRIITLNFNRN